MSGFILVALGGFFGSILRFLISLGCKKHFFGTWIANITGSVLMAVLLKLYLSDSLSHGMWLTLGVGFCGSYTTFSTFSYETLQLLLNRKYLTASLYVFTTFFISLSFVAMILISSK